MTSRLNPARLQLTPDWLTRVLHPKMPTMFRDLERAFANELDVSRLNAALTGWRVRMPTLARFDSIDALVTFFRAKGSDDEKSKAVVTLAELCRQGDEQAKLLVGELFMPALRGTLSRFRGGPLSSDELESEIAAAFWELVTTTTEETPKPLARLGRRPGDRVLEVIRRERAREKPELPIEELQELAAGTPWPEPSKPGRRALGERETRVLAEARDDGVLTEFEAQLIAMTRIEGLTLDEARVRLGGERSTEALGAARRRAEGLLRAWVEGKEPPPRRKV
jgi:hypothetical protein